MMLNDIELSNGCRIFIDPVAKPRMTRSDKWAERDVVMRYRAFADELRLRFNRFKKLQPLPSVLYLKFVLPMPESWSQNKRISRYDTPHNVKPDIDNLVKAVLDVLCENDSYIHTILATKWYGGEGSVEIQSLENTKTIHVS